MKPAGRNAKVPQPSEEVELHPAVRHIFSTGYEGKSLEEFIALLKGAGIERLIDVRDAPFSRKPGFSKAPLEQALKASAIEYIGIPELGTDKASRDSHRTDSSIEPVLEEFRRKLGRNAEHYERLKRLAHERPSAIMCFEADFRQCHRQAIEERLAHDGFDIVHLDARPKSRPEKPLTAP